MPGPDIVIHRNAPNQSKARLSQPSRSTIRRTGRLLNALMPVSCSALAARPVTAVVVHTGKDETLP
jgi:hypothetical protein